MLERSQSRRKQAPAPARLLLLRVYTIRRCHARPKAAAAERHPGASLSKQRATLASQPYNIAYSPCARECLIIMYESLKYSPRHPPSPRMARGGVLSYVKYAADEQNHAQKKSSAYTLQRWPETQPRNRRRLHNNKKRYSDGRPRCLQYQRDEEKMAGENGAGCCRAYVTTLHNKTTPREQQDEQLRGDESQITSSPTI